MSIGGGLYDHGPDPWGRDRSPGPASEPRWHAQAREALFWALMIIGTWAAFQGQVLTATLFLFVIVTTPAVIFLVQQMKEQFQESKEKGFWR